MFQVHHNDDDEAQTSPSVRHVSAELQLEGRETLCSDDDEAQILLGVCHVPCVRPFQLHAVSCSARERACSGDRVHAGESDTCCTE